MGNEILPSGAEGWDETTQKEWVSGLGEKIITTKSGDVTQIEAIYEADKLAGIDDSLISSVTLNSKAGKATTVMTTTPNEDDPTTAEDGNQELLAIDVIRPLYTAPYFQSLTYTEVGDVRRAKEDGIREVVGGWNALQQKLFKHIIMGRDKYYETAYIFRKTFITSSNATLQRSATNINTVQSLPDLSAGMENLIDSLPTGEWLKRPTQCRYLGKSGYSVSEEYLWAPNWSVVYGGTFDGSAIV
jgi:hypothetical protein